MNYMVRLNQNVLDQQQLDGLFRQLSTEVAPHDPNRADQVLTEVLGTEERIMIAKRLAVVVLLVEGTSMYKIGKLLKLSQTTVEHLSKRLEDGHFDKTLNNVAKTKKDYFAFLDTLDNILHLGGLLPHYNGLDRYRNLLR